MHDVLPWARRTVQDRSRDGTAMIVIELDEAQHASSRTFTNNTCSRA